MGLLEDVQQKQERVKLERSFSFVTKALDIQKSQIIGDRNQGDHYVKQTLCAQERTLVLHLSDVFKSANPEIQKDELAQKLEEFYGDLPDFISNHNHGSHEDPIAHLFTKEALPLANEIPKASVRVKSAYGEDAYKLVTLQAQRIKELQAELLS